MSDISRRDFVKMLAAAGAISQFPGIIGCRGKAAGNVPFDRLLKEVQQLQRSLSAFPANPVSVAWDPNVDEYPPTRKIERWFRGESSVYPLVEKALMLLNKDNPENPLSGIIRKGDTVVVKPNWGTQYLFPLPVTHPSVIVPIIEYAVKAGASRVVIAEGPMTLYRSQKYFWGPAFINAYNLVKELKRRHSGVEFRFQDANDDQFYWVALEDASAFSEIYSEADLDHDGHTGFLRNMFFNVPDCTGYNPGKYRIGLYAVARSFLDADVFISVPKLKTHGWSGITAALKNHMGTTLRTTSQYMPESTMLEYQKHPDFASYRESPLRDVPHYKTEYWDGKGFVKRKLIGYENDVLWRSLGDLNRAARYADKTGKMHDSFQRRYLTVVDAVISTDRGGPTSPSTVATSAIVAGFDPVAVDSVCLRMMNWNYERIRLVKNVNEFKTYPVGSIGKIEEEVIGASLNSAAFSKFFVPPANYSDEVLAPKTVKL